jgi:hypothetical protein
MRDYRDLLNELCGLRVEIAFCKVELRRLQQLAGVTTGKPDTQ